MHPVYVYRYRLVIMNRLVKMSGFSCLVLILSLPIFSRGILEICSTISDGDLTWRRICASNFVTANAEIACRQLQLSQNWNYNISNVFVRSNGYFCSSGSHSSANNLSYTCQGNEIRLDQCQRYEYQYSCYPVGITCLPSDKSAIPECPSQFSRPVSCANGLCLRYSSIECNGYNDCGDCSDECHCSWPRYYGGACRGSRTVNICNCTNSEFRCQNGFCTQSNYLCDGKDNCGDWSDETNEECYQRRQEQVREVDRRAQRAVDLSVGVGLGVPLTVIALWLVVLALCMFIPGCPLGKLYHAKLELTTTASDTYDNDPQSEESLLSQTQEQTA